MKLRWGLVLEWRPGLGLSWIQASIATLYMERGYVRGDVRTKYCRRCGVCIGVVILDDCGCVGHSRRRRKDAGSGGRGVYRSGWLESVLRFFFWPL